MGEKGLDVLPAFLAFLSARPSPESVLAALISGPAAAFSAHAGILLVARDSSLRLIGSYRYSADELAGFDVIPLSADLPICEAVREGEVIVLPASHSVTSYAGLAAERERWAQQREVRAYGSIVSVPLVVRGAAVGAFGFTCDDDRTWDPQDITALDALAGAVALWMAHPDSGLDAGAGPSVSSELAITITVRQHAILEAAARGRTNAAIGAALGYSESTVKQELHRVMRALGTSGRAQTIARARALGLAPAEDAGA